MFILKKLVTSDTFSCRMTNLNAGAVENRKLPFAPIDSVYATESFTV